MVPRDQGQQKKSKSKKKKGNKEKSKKTAKAKSVTVPKASRRDQPGTQPESQQWHARRTHEHKNTPTNEKSITDGERQNTRTKKPKSTRAHTHSQLATTAEKQQHTSKVILGMAPQDKPTQQIGMHVRPFNMTIWIPEPHYHTKYYQAYPKRVKIVGAKYHKGYSTHRQAPQTQSEKKSACIAQMDTKEPPTHIAQLTPPEPPRAKVGVDTQGPNRWFRIKHGNEETNCKAP